MIGNLMDQNLDGGSKTDTVSPLEGNTTTISVSGGDSDSVKTTTTDLSTTAIDNTTAPGTSIYVTTTDNTSCNVVAKYYADGIPVIGSISKRLFTCDVKGNTTVTTTYDTASGSANTLITFPDYTGTPAEMMNPNIDFDIASLISSDVTEQDQVAPVATGSGADGHPINPQGFRFNHIAFQILDEDDSFAYSDLVNPGDTGDECGIAVYKDNGDGVFDADTDTRISYDSTKNGGLPKLSTMTTGETSLHMIELFLDAKSFGDDTSKDYDIPTNNTGANAGPDFFLVLKPTNTAEPGEKFKIQLHGSDLLETRDDTISYVYRSKYVDPITFAVTYEYPDVQAPAMTYKRFQSSDYYTVYSVTNDVISDLVATGGMQITPLGDSKAAFGINVSYPTTLNNGMSLQKIRVYFDSDDGLNPAWILNSLDGTETAGLQLRDANDNYSLIPTTATWKSDADNSFIPYDSLDDGVTYVQADISTSFVLFNKITEL